MYGSMLMQSGYNQFQEKIDTYFIDTLDTNVLYYKNLIESIDKFTGRTFTTYFNKTKNLVESNTENAKEVIRSGKFKC